MNFSCAHHWVPGWCPCLAWAVVLFSSGVNRQSTCSRCYKWARLRIRLRKHTKKHPSWLMLLDYVRQKVERMEAGDRWKFCQESQIQTSPRAWQWGTLQGVEVKIREPSCPSYVACHFPAIADEGIGHHNINIMFSRQALFYLFCVIIEKISLCWGKKIRHEE